MFDKIMPSTYQFIPILGMAESLNTEYKSDTFFFYALSYFDQVFIICCKTVIPLLPMNHNAV